MKKETIYKKKEMINMNVKTALKKANLMNRLYDLSLSLDIKIADAQSIIQKINWMVLDKEIESDENIQKILDSQGFLNDMRKRADQFIKIADEENGVGKCQQRFLEALDWLKKHDATLEEVQEFVSEMYSEDLNTNELKKEISNELKNDEE